MTEYELERKLVGKLERNGGDEKKRKAQSREYLNSLISNIIKDKGEKE